MNRRHRRHQSAAQKTLGHKLVAAAIAAGALTTGAVASPDPDLLTEAHAQGPVVVPAGQTTTVDLGVALNVNTNQDGFTIVSSGTSVSVTAPAGGGQTSVPVSYGGYSSVITIIAEASASEASVDGQSVDEILNDPNLGGVGSGADGAGTPDSSDAGQPATPGASGIVGEGQSGGGAGSSNGDGYSADNPAPRPVRGLAPALDTTQAPQVELAGEIQANQLIVQLSMTQALNLYNQFGGNDPSSVDVRYVDGDGQVIEGVRRDIDKAARRLTLTYPEGQTPDNPFIIQVLHSSDGSAAAVVTITSPGKLTTKDGGTAVVSDAGSSSDRNFVIAVVAVAVVVLAVIIALIASLRAARRRRRARKS